MVRSFFESGFEKCFDFFFRSGPIKMIRALYTCNIPCSFKKSFCLFQLECCKNVLALVWGLKKYVVVKMLQKKVLTFLRLSRFTKQWKGGKTFF